MESFLKKFERILQYKFFSMQMSLLELHCSFKVVASILNRRPIYARWGTRGGDDPDYISSLTHMILNGWIPVRDYESSVIIQIVYVEECVAK